MCLLLKEKSPPNKDEIGFFPVLLSVLLPFPPGQGAGAARFVCPGMLTGTPRCPGGLWQGFGVPSTAAPLPEPRVQGLGRAATGRGQSE